MRGTGAVKGHGCHRLPASVPIPFRWLPFLRDNIPISQFDPLKTLANNAKIAQWSNQGLPSDILSIQVWAQCSSAWVSGGRSAPYPSVVL